jgi:parallel beta-helix repeat protein
MYLNWQEQVESMRKAIIFALAFLLLLPLAKADTYLTSCAVLDTPGETYYLTQDIIDSTAPLCMNITADNVTLDCQGHTIDGIWPASASAGTYGIYVYRDSETMTNITIKKCVITGWDYLTYFYYSNYNTLSNITASSNGNGFYFYYSNYNTLSDITTSSGLYGFSLYYSNYNTLSDITANYNRRAFYLYYSNYNTLSDITANYNLYGLVGYGFYLYYSNSNTLSNITANYNLYGFYIVYSNSTIKNSIIQNNSQYGIILYLAENTPNLIYNNLFNNTNNIYFGAIYSNGWNTTKQIGTRIYSAGTQMGGNYWTNPDGNGYSDICRDTEGDGFCDSPYVLATDNIDYLPYSKWYGSPTWGAPRWSNNSTFIPSTYDYNTLSVFNITWNDSLGYSIDTVLFESNFSGTPTNYTMTLIDPYINATENKGVYNFNVTLPAGTFYWKSYAKASDGVWNVSDTWYFTINKAIPALTLTAYPSWSIFYPAETNVTGSESNLGDSDLTYNLYRNDVLVSNPDVATLAVGSYVYVYNTSGGQNYTANSVSNTLTVSALPPVHGVPLLSSTLVGIVIGVGIITFMLRTLFDITMKGDPKKIIEYFIVLAVIVLTVLSLTVLFA